LREFAFSGRIDRGVKGYGGQGETVWWLRGDQYFGTIFWYQINVRINIGFFCPFFRSREVKLSVSTGGFFIDGTVLEGYRDKANTILLSETQRKQLQHEFKIYMEKYFKQKLGKGVDYTKIVIWDDMLVIRGEGFLTMPEKYINETPSGREVVRAARMQVVKQHALDNIPYFEGRLKAKAIHQAYELEPEKDFWMHVVVFDRILTSAGNA